MKNILIYSNLILAIALVSCNSSSSKGGHDDHGHGDHGHGGHGEHDEGSGIHLTTEQTTSIGLEFGTTTQVKLNDYVKASGKLTLPSNAVYSVNAKTSGFLQTKGNYFEGSTVKKGDVIAYLENPDLISKQQDYLEAKANFKFLQSEIKRQEELVSSNAGVLKALEKTRADYEIAEAQKKGLAKQLSFLGISSSKLTADNITQRLSIVAPTTGVITKLNLNNGLFVESNTELVKIVDQTKAMLKLNIYEKDISKLKEGSAITYTISSSGTAQYDATIATINQEFNSENQTISVMAELTDVQPKFINGLIVQGKIWLNDQTVTALPSDAIIQDGADVFIFVGSLNPQDEVDFVKINVIKGASDKGYTAVKFLQELPANMEIVTKGAYYVYAQSKVGSLKHEH